MLKKLFYLVIILLPISLILAYFNNPILDVDALAYHLFSAKIVEQGDFNFFSRPSVNLNNSLGWEIGIFYPWFYGYLIAVIHKFINFSYDQSAYIVSIVAYLIAILKIKNIYKNIVISIFFSIPFIFTPLFISGNNYFISALLIFLLFSTNTIKIKGFRFFLGLAISFLMINTHVLLIYPVIIFYLIECISSIKDLKTGSKKDLYIFIFSVVVLLSYLLIQNFLNTGSITFPFLQNIFPHINYDPDSWKIITEHLHRSIFYSDLTSSKLIILFFILSNIFMIVAIKNSNISTYNKFAFYLLIAPAFLFFILGYRHRIIFNIAAFMFFIHLLNLEYLKNFILKKITYLLNNKLFFIIFIFLALFTMLYKHTQVINISYHDEIIQKRHQWGVGSYIINSKPIFLEFYNTINELSKDNKVLYTEIPVLGIDNYSNLINPLILNAEIKNLNNYNEFHSLLINHEIKYLTITPLSSNNMFNVKYPHVGFLQELIDNNLVILRYDFVDPKLTNLIDGSENNVYWRIYEVVQ